jgi:carbon monoxide dehydrogenase subunit G
MMKTDATITIRQAPEVVFSYLTDIEKIQQWSPVENMKLLTSGPVDVGSQFSQTVSILGKSFESVTEVTANDPPTSYAFKAISGPMTFEQHFTLTPTTEGTKLDTTIEGEPGGLLKLAGPVLASAVNKQLNDQFQKLKQLLEH